MDRILEICAADIDSVRAAAEGGAQRVELCSALALGGITPSEGFIAVAASYKTVKCHVLIRPREGDFVYSPEELAVMLRDIDTAASCGASGVVIGALTPDDRVDTDACALLIKRAKDHGLSVTFHRAFDCVTQPFEALDAVISLGADRLLTSGCAKSAPEGAAMLKRLNERAAGRISLIAAAGINSGNAAVVLRLSGCSELHSSARRPLPQGNAVNRSISSVAAGFYADRKLTACADEVRAILSVMKLQ